VLKCGCNFESNRFHFISALHKEYVLFIYFGQISIIVTLILLLLVILIKSPMNLVKILNKF
jgi:hypothetical protein